MRRLIVAFAAGALLVLSVPVVADHAAEPAAPVTGVELRLAEYSTGTPADCGDRVGFQNLRIEVWAAYSGKPTEHWTTRLTVAQSEDPNRRVQWYALWTHQNFGPHERKNPAEVAQSQQALTPGPWTVTVRLTGDESGNEFVESCTIFR